MDVEGVGGWVERKGVKGRGKGKGSIFETDTDKINAENGYCGWGMDDRRSNRSFWDLVPSFFVI